LNFVAMRKARGGIRLRMSSAQAVFMACELLSTSARSTMAETR
jgi:hypothetical protein